MGASIFYLVIYAIVFLARVLTYGSALFIPAAFIVVKRRRVKRPIGKLAVLFITVGALSAALSLLMLISSWHWHATHERYEIVYYENKSTIGRDPRGFEFNGVKYTNTGVRFENHDDLKEGEIVAGIYNTDRGNLRGLYPDLPPWFKLFDGGPTYDAPLYALENDGGFTLYYVYYHNKNVYCAEADKEAVEAYYGVADYDK